MNIHPLICKHLANAFANNRQTRDNYLFVVDNSSEANSIDWYNAYLEVNFKLSQKDQEQDGAGDRCWNWKY